MPHTYTCAVRKFGKKCLDQCLKPKANDEYAIKAENSLNLVNKNGIMLLVNTLARSRQWQSMAATATCSYTVHTTRIQKNMHIFSFVIQQPTVAHTACMKEDAC
jgi:hypothetical protein